MLTVSGWLGGKMVYLAGVAVTPAPETAAPSVLPEGERTRAWASYIDSPATGRRARAAPGGMREGHAFAHGAREAGDDSDKSNVNRER